MRPRHIFDREATRESAGPSIRFPERRVIEVHPTSLIEGAGVVLAATSGIIEARRKGMDLVGVYAVAFITAFGGGTLRDILLDRRPFYWQGNPSYSLIIFVVSVAYLYGPSRLRRAANHPRLELPEQVLDALSLGLFSVVSTIYALEHGSTLFIASPAVAFMSDIMALPASAVSLAAFGLHAARLIVAARTVTSAIVFFMWLSLCL